MIAGAVMVFVFVVAAWLPRILLVVERGLEPVAASGRGFVAAAAGALALVAALGMLAGRARPLWLVGALGWVLAQWANYESIAALDAPAGVTYISYLLDDTFFRGSVLAPTSPAALLAHLGFTLVLVWRIVPRLPGRSFAAAPAIGSLSLALVVWLWPVDPAASAWRQHGLVRWTGSAPEAAAGDAARRLETLLAPDLDGEPWTRLGRARSNVLVVVLEGVSGAYLPSTTGVDGPITMPELDGLAERHPTVVRFVAQQRQTNRGLYALLCGRLPKLTSEAARLTEYAVAPGPACLPEVLSGRGYATSFLQGSPLAFMLKDEAMPRLGFDTVAGDRGEGEARLRTPWGIDDESFFSRAADEVRRLDSGEAPWMLTLLTVGTHHPFTVPTAAGETTGLPAAIRFLDRAAVGFLDELSADGLLENTLVVVTSDESAGMPGEDDLTRALTQNWGLAILMVPGEGPRQIEEPFAQSDLVLSVLDYVGRPDEASGFTGRSLFRVYEDLRPLFFANTYQRRVTAFQPPDRLLVCGERGDDCTTWPVAPGDPFTITGAAEPAVFAETLLAAAVERSRRPFGPEASERRYGHATGTSVQLAAPGDRRLLLGGQYLDAAAGSTVEVVLEGVVGPGAGWVHVRHDLVSEGAKHYLAELPVLASGDRFRLVYQVGIERSVRRLAARSYADLLAGGPLAVTLTSGELTIREGGAAPGVPEVVEATIERAVAPEPQPWSLSVTEAETPPCVRSVADGWRATQCTSGELLYGPRRYLPRGSRLEVVHRVRALSGPVRLVSMVGSEQPSLVLARSEVVELEAGSTGEVRLELEMEAVLNEVVVGLFSESEGAVDLEIEGVEGRIVWP